MLLEGPTGAGKSTLIRELARRTGNDDMIELHLDDSMDSKSLIGTYVCTDVPGEFKWQAGPLTQVRAGVLSRAGLAPQHGADRMVAATRCNAVGRLFGKGAGS